ncbi:MAG TPA: GatB/YqeY domain-containing protein [Bacteroidia bacterium]|nr:GatB/YqeY domain-containing protein [Bacteroidia bacterium]HNT80010.1 GatB/YqeY domain-containing protein [Bacteroidia bacterium]
MSLEQQIMAELKSAMMNKNEGALRALRAVKAAILLEKTSGKGDQIDAEAELKIVQKLVKQRKESIDIYLQQNREDLARTEQEELEVISKFLPEQMDEQQVNNALVKIIGDLGASSMADMGKVMKEASVQLSGKADNKMVSELVRKLLAAS